MLLKTLMTGAILVAAVAGSAIAGECVLSPEAQSGKMVSNQCKSCHVFEADKPSRSTAPNLHDVFGEKAGLRKDFPNYSPAIAAANVKGLTWTAEKLDEYLIDPKAFLAAVTGNPELKHNMFFNVKDDQKRKDVVAFLKAIKNKPDCN